MQCVRDAVLAFLLVAMCLFSAYALAKPEFVGTQQCVDCHQSQHQAWQGSHHDMAMKHANEQSVLGDFNDVNFISNGITNRFYTKNKEYWVKITGPDRKLTDYKISYTFGYEPLQQYMVEFEDGRVQLIPFSWDSRPKQEGGQRWFNLYPDQTETHQTFFWTNTGQNWNYMCADCHSTNVEKNYDVNTNTYKTTFSEINVGCEACHGAASEHLAWSKQPSEHLNLGFDRDLSQAVMQWIKAPNKQTLQPAEINPTQQTLVCAQCHSRHVQLGTDKNYIKNNAFGDRYLLSFIDSQLYYPDGQVYDENYVYGSFLQSKMSQQGVTCTNCHDPHSAKLKIEPEKVCLQCHQSDAYNTPDHHKHPINSTGAQCVNCHMPETTYMQIDKRRDHGWHSPRPDFALQLGTPDTCLSCHQDKDSQWSLSFVNLWYPQKDLNEERPFAPVFAAIDQGYQQASSALSHIAQNNQQPGIIRASALERMTPLNDPNTLIALARAVKHADEHIRVGAVRGSESLPPTERWQLLQVLLSDKVLSVRTEAAQALARDWQILTAAQQHALKGPLAEYRQIQAFNSDRGFAHTNIGTLNVYQGRYAEAEQAYLMSIKIEPYFAEAYIQLAELHRRQNNEVKVIATLKQGQQANPDADAVSYQLALAYVRSKQTEQAIVALNQAIKAQSGNPQYHFVLGLITEANNPMNAQMSLAKAYQLSGNPEHLFSLCEMQIRHQNPSMGNCVKELKNYAPAAVILQLEQQINAIKQSN